MWHTASSRRKRPARSTRRRLEIARRRLDRRIRTAGATRHRRVARASHLVSSPPGTRHLYVVEKVLTSLQVRSELALHVRSFLCVGPIIADTDLVALVPSNLAALVAANLDLCVCKPKVKFPSFDICMYWHRRFHQDPASSWLRNTVEDLFSRRNNG